MNKTGGWALAIKERAIFSTPRNPFSKFPAAVTIRQSAHSTLLLALHPTWNIHVTRSHQKHRVPRKRKHHSLCQTTTAPGTLACKSKRREGRAGRMYRGCGGANAAVQLACLCPSINTCTYSQREKNVWMRCLMFHTGIHLGRNNIKSSCGGIYM